MPICITGMHRSGTSMVARLLHLSGLALGPESDLHPAAPDNPEGFWENTHFVALSDELLKRLDGGWDLPPVVPAGWEDRDDLEDLRDQARKLIAGFSGMEPWGWKDPRASLLIPFYRRLIPDLKVVVCVRNPLEVAESLNRRAHCSRQFGLNLWMSHNQRLLAATEPAGRVMTHYQAFFDEAEAELRRLLEALGIRAMPEQIVRACGTASAGLRHNHYNTAALLQASVPTDVVSLYTALCGEAGPVCLASMNQDLLDASAESAIEFKPMAPTLETRVAEQMLRIEQLTGALADRDGAAAVQEKLEQAETRLAAMEATAIEHRHVLDESASKMAQKDQALSELTRRTADLQMQVQTLAEQKNQWQAAGGNKDRVIARLSEQLSHYIQRTQELESQWATFQSEKMGRQSNSLPMRMLRALLFGPIGSASRYGVIPRSDPDRPTGIFRQAWLTFRVEGLRGLMIGIGHRSGLFRLRAAVHQTVLTYRAEGLRGVRRGIRRRLHGEPATPPIVAPTPPVAQARTSVKLHPSPWDPILEEFQARFDQDPSILDWQASLTLSGQIPRHTVFRPPADGPTLPYLDQTIDIVVMDSSLQRSMKEAERVCRGAVVLVTASTHPPQLQVHWRQAAPTTLPSVSIIIPVYNGVAHTAGCLDALRQTLPPTLAVQIIVVDDASTDDTAEELQRRAARDSRLEILRNEKNSGFIASCNRGAAAAEGDILVFLNNDTLPHPGWLPPLLRTFRDFPEAGAVGGKLIYPDGTLQEAGGVIFSDASGANYGKGDPDADAPLYSYVREVDYCSGALLATPRALFRELDGFDTRYAPAYYEDTDYCFRLRERGRRVYFQPDSTVVHLEGATSGTDTSAGVKRYQAVNRKQFRSRWEQQLRHQPPPPNRIDADTWHRLAVRSNGHGGEKS